MRKIYCFYLLTLVLANIVSVSNLGSFSNGFFNTSLLLRTSSSSYLQCDSGSAVPVTFRKSYWDSTTGNQYQQVVIDGINSLISQLNDNPSYNSVSFSSGNVNGAIWVGNMLSNTEAIHTFLNRFLENVQSEGIGKTKSLEYVYQGDPAKTIGVMFDTVNHVDIVHNSIQKWSMGQQVEGYTGYQDWSAVLCYLDYSDRKQGNNPTYVGTCYYLRIESGMDLASATGVTTDAIELYNTNLNFNNLAVGTPICYSVGSEPNFKPNENNDGSCYVYTIQPGDTCAAVAATYYPLTLEEINEYNTDNYAWKGCNDFLINDKMCLSSGTPPRPISDPNAECGPHAPGDKYLSKCPLNACCSQFGYCGYTSDYCDSSCFSNCNYGSISSGSSPSFKSAAYWMDTYSTLHQDVSTLDKVYDIIFYAFATINGDMSISTGPNFYDFVQLQNSERIISFGGWDFSTSVSTYYLLREAITSDTFITNLVNFISDNKLDGVNFDWEYPGEPDIAGIPAGSSEDGENYLNLLKNIKSKLPDISISVAIPSSYWYLKHFPLSEMNSYVDFFVVMNYDYYGQWGYGKDNGVNCHVDRTVTTSVYKMLNKAGIPFNKLYGGLANYARTFQLLTPSKYSKNSGYTGPDSGAVLGPISQIRGVLTNVEIESYSSEFSQNFYDDDSNCQISVYKDTWIGWMTEEKLSELKDWYNSIGLGGSVLWSTNYDISESYNDNIPTTSVNFTNDENEIKSRYIYSLDGSVTEIWSKSDRSDLVTFTKLKEYLGIDADIVSFSFYLKALDIYNKNKILFSSDTAAIFELQLAVLNGLNSDILSGVRNKNSKELQFFDYIFSVVFPFDTSSIYTFKNAYDSLNWDSERNLAYWGRMDSSAYGFLLNTCSTTDYEMIHDELKKRGDKFNPFNIKTPLDADDLFRKLMTLLISIRLYSEYIDNRLPQAVSMFAEDVNNPYLRNQDSELESSYIEGGTLNIFCTENTNLPTPTLASIYSPRPEPTGLLTPSVLRQTDPMFSNIVFPDAGSVYNHIAKLIHDSVIDCDKDYVYIYNLTDQQDHTQPASNFLINLYNNRMELHNLLINNHLIYQKLDGKFNPDDLETSRIDRKRITGKILVDKSKRDRDEQPPNSIKIKGTTFDNRLNFIRVAYVDAKGNRSQGSDLKNRFYNTNLGTLNINYRYRIPRLASYSGSIPVCGNDNENIISPDTNIFIFVISADNTDLYANAPLGTSSLN